MAIDSDVGFVNTNGAAFPDNESVNASGPTATDGTEFVKLMVDNYMFGRQQALLNYANLVPDGVAEKDGTSQEVEAMQNSFGAPGEAVDWYGNNDPATLGHKILILEGQGILVASFPELDAAVYTGDGDNATADAFFHADDAAGVVRNTAGIWLILPDARGVVKRAMDIPAGVDPDGAGRVPGDGQLDQFQGHQHAIERDGSQFAGGSNFGVLGPGTGTVDVGDHVRGPTVLGANGSPRFGTETRMVNLSLFFGIRY